jgi:hypothetical protein
VFSIEVERPISSSKAEILSSTIGDGSSSSSVLVAIPTPAIVVVK